MRSGVATLAGGLALLAAGLFFGSPPIELPGIALILLSLAMRAWVIHSSKRLRVEVLPGPTTTIEGDPYPLTLRIVGARSFSPGGWIEHPGLQASRTELAAPLPQEVPIEPVFERRGRHRLGAATLVVSDPLGQQRSTVVGEDRGRVLVLPRVEPVELLEAEGGADGIARMAHLESLLDGSAPARSAGMDVDVDGLRPHQPGSPSSRIHWPTVARTGEMFERLLIANADGGPLVLLDASDPASDEALDSAVRAAASLCLALGRSGGCSLMVGAGERSLAIDRALRGWPAAHAALALAGPAARPPPVRNRRLDAAFWVTAAAVPAIRSVTRATYIVSPSATNARVMFRVAGCAGWQVSGSGAGRRRALAA